MKMCEMVGWWTLDISKNLYKSRQEKGYTQTEIQLQRHSIEKYLWNRLQTTEAILPPPVNPPISVQLGAVRVDPATQYFSNPTHLYLDAFLLLSFFYFEQFQIIALSITPKNGAKAISIQNLLRRGARSGVQLSCTETRFQKCSQVVKKPKLV